MSPREGSRIAKKLWQLGASLGGATESARDGDVLPALLTDVSASLAILRMARPGDEWDLFHDAIVRALEVDAREGQRSGQHARNLARFLVRCSLATHLRGVYAAREAVQLLSESARADEGGGDDEW